MSCTVWSEFSIIVPLNFGTETPLSLNPHFLHGVAALSFWVPQLGQNTDVPPIAIVAFFPSADQNNSWSVVLPGVGGDLLGWRRDRARGGLSASAELRG
jgi:hypothetical protein